MSHNLTFEFLRISGLGYVDVNIDFMQRHAEGLLRGHKCPYDANSSSNAFASSKTARVEPFSELAVNRGERAAKRFQLVFRLSIMPPISPCSNSLAEIPLMTAFVTTARRSRRAIIWLRCVLPTTSNANLFAVGAKFRN
jgi:hypothetical protein